MYARRNKNRSIGGNEWTVLRAAIAGVVAAGNIPPADFKPVPAYLWQKVFKKIQSALLEEYSQQTSFTWLWYILKQEAYGFDFRGFRLEDMLQLFEMDEYVWLLTEERHNERTKYWLYEGRLSTIVTVLNDATHLDEFYLVDKKYRWLLCLNHHDVLIGTGGDMPARLRELEQKLKAPKQ